MLPQKNRIPRKDFPTGSRQGFRVFSPLFSGVVHPLITGVRVSVVVSKKTVKTAVMRNNLRRRLYAAIAPLLKDMVHPALIVIYPKAEAQQASFSILQREVESALRHAKLVK